MPINRSSKDLSWRLVHDGKKVIHLFESSGITQTINKLFTGTIEECESMSKSLGLTGYQEAFENSKQERVAIRDTSRNH